MQLDNITAVVRPRSSWEAADLGILMARAWWWPLCRAWLAATLPVFLLLQVALYNYPMVAIFMFWWLKPIWERPLLHILSRALFGQLPGLRETLRVFPKLAATQWFASLTYRRLSTTRSMDLPVIQLENLKGKQRAGRLRLLHGNTGTGADWLTFIGIHVEMVLPVAFFTFVFMMLPGQVDLGWDTLLTADDQLYLWWFNFLAYIVMGLVAPFYVAAGFSLYLNRRIWLEGWDMELVFRRLAQRVQSRGALGRVAALLAAVALSFTAPPDLAMAQSQTLTREQSKAQIEAIMEGETFHQIETVRRLDWDQPPEAESDVSDIPQWLGDMAELLAANLRYVLWGMAILLVLIFLFKQRRWLKEFIRPAATSPGEQAPPTVLFGMEVTSETLPEDVLAEVDALWRDHQYRAAYGLLYRAALNRLIQHYRIPFRSGHTEQECRRLVAEQTAPELAEYFSELTHHWQRLAYAHQPPATETMESLCRRWPRFFQEPGHG